MPELNETQLREHITAHRIAAISPDSSAFANLTPVAQGNLPPPGPYPTGRDAFIALNALRAAKQAIAAAEEVVSAYLR